MTTFDERERAYEAHFALEEEVEFRAHARRDRMLGVWAGERMGLDGSALHDYALSIVQAEVRHTGEDDVFNKVLADLAERGVECLPHELRSRMDEFLRKARADLAAGR